LFFVVVSLYFGINFFWIETFCLLFLAIFLASVNQNDRKNLILSGLAAGLIVITRPVLAPGLFLLTLFSKKQKTFHPLFLLSSLLPFLITLSYLFYHNIFTDFIGLFFNFNTTNYLQDATKLPALRQLFFTTLLFLLTIFMTYKNKKIRFALPLILFLLPAYPRFEMFHLLPFTLLSSWLIFSSKIKKQNLTPILIVLAVFSLLVLAKISRAQYGNFYYNRNLKTLTQFINSLEVDTIYLLAAPDLLYVTTNKLPPNNFYLPSLPWYLKNPVWQDRQINSLKQSPQTPIFVCPSAKRRTEYNRHQRQNNRIY